MDLFDLFFYKNIKRINKFNNIFISKKKKKKLKNIYFYF